MPHFLGRRKVYGRLQSHFFIQSFYPACRLFVWIRSEGRIGLVPLNDSTESGFEIVAAACCMIEVFRHVVGEAHECVMFKASAQSFAVEPCIFFKEGAIARIEHVAVSPHKFAG